jgi:predicted dehydrogenase/nucleoside-diphosphate-sugar epimerase
VHRSQPPRPPFRVGLVGAGYVSEFHVRALQRLPGVRIAGITDLVEPRARAAAARFGITAHPSLAAMVDAGLDVVHVLTPPASHTAVALDALRHGCHVLVEKPLATSVDDCDRLAAESAAVGRSVCVCHSMLADPTFVRLVEAVRGGAVGEVLSVDVLRSSVYAPYRGGPPPPQYGDGGYPFRDLGVHALYMLRELLGPIEGVTPEFRTAGALAADPNVYFDEWRALVRCARGSGHVQLSWNVRPLQHLFIVQGTRGTLRADLYSMFISRRRNTPAPKAIERVLNTLAESAQSAVGVLRGAGRFAAGRVVPYQGLHSLVEEFYRSLAENRPVPVTVESARSIVEWTERVARPADAAKLAARPSRPTRTQAAVVVTGANGLLGRALVRRLLDRGERLRLFVRREPSPEVAGHPLVEVVIGDLGDPAAVRRGLGGATTVFHCGAAMFGAWPAHESGTIEGTRNVIAACLDHGVGKLVHVSSLSVLHNAALAGTVVTESSPLEPRPEERGAYSRAKREAEALVREAVDAKGLPAVILRPGHIWTEQGPLLSPAVGMRAGRLLLMLGDPGVLLPLVHVDDVVSALFLAREADVPPGSVFHLVDDDPISRKELARLYRDAREPSLRIVHVPMGVATTAAGLLTGVTRAMGRPLGPSPYRLRAGVAPLRFDCTKARQELGWRPAVKSRTALLVLLGRRA